MLHLSPLATWSASSVPTVVGLRSVFDAGVADELAVARRPLRLDGVGGVGGVGGAEAFVSALRAVVLGDGRADDDGAYVMPA